jgi:hypothetical protein
VTEHPEDVQRCDADEPAAEDGEGVSGVVPVEEGRCRAAGSRSLLGGAAVPGWPHGEGSDSGALERPDKGLPSRTSVTAAMPSRATPRRVRSPRTAIEVAAMPSVALRAVSR